MLTYFLNVSPGWRGTMRLKLVAGRDFRPDEATPGAALVNETFAREYFNGENPVGKSFLRGRTTVPYRIVGLVADAPYRSIREPILPVAYVPFRQVDSAGAPGSYGRASFIVRTGGANPLALAQTMRLEEVRRLAFTDPLTGLANRRAVDVRLDEALERHRAGGVPVSLLVCDLNGLKRVNDSLGHDVGDQLLVGFGSVLSLCGAMLGGSLAARLGGDEFCLLVEGRPAAEVERAAEELCVRARKLGLGEGVAVGVASTDAGAGPVHSARRLFRLADAAQYRAKAEHALTPVIAGREVAELADTPPAAARERRRFRGRRPPP